jgi:hypothetical protein
MEYIVYKTSAYVDDNLFCFFDYSFILYYFNFDNSFMFFVLIALLAIFALVFRHTSGNGLPRIRDQTVIYINLFANSINKYVLSRPVAGYFNLLQKIRDGPNQNIK